VARLGKFNSDRIFCHLSDHGIIRAFKNGLVKIISSNGQRVPTEVLVSIRMIHPEMLSMNHFAFLAESLEKHSWGIDDFT
jgi:hypothetical protein